VNVVDEKILIAIGSGLTGLFSLWYKFRRAQMHVQLGEAKHANVHTETILGGYGKIVEDLRTEIERLHSNIGDMRKEQEECDRRNDELARVVDELRRRVTFLEATTND
jgi:predicted RNase H-like nuclease (RuvC/YqgF family)